MLPPNALPISRAAPIDQQSNRAETNHQNGYDLGAAKRRRLHGLVGPHSARWLQNAIYGDFGFGDMCTGVRLGFFGGTN